MYHPSLTSVRHTVVKRETVSYAATHTSGYGVPNVTGHVWDVVTIERYRERKRNRTYVVATHNTRESARADARNRR